MLRSTSVVFISNSSINFLSYYNLLEASLGECSRTKNSLPWLTTFGQTSSTKGSLSTVECHTYLRWTQNGSMHGTLENSTFTARGVDCVIAKKSTTNGWVDNRA